MLFILFLLSSIFPHLHSEFISYTLYQTNDLCQHNWQRSICLPIFSLNQTNQPLTIQLNISNQNHCPTQILVYIRSRQCIYCAKNLDDIHCHHQRIRRMTPTEQHHIHRNRIAIICISLLGILIVGSLFALIFIKRTPAHTNLLELSNQQQQNPPSHLQSINRTKIPSNIKTSRPIHLTVPKKIKPRK